ncbi:MAG: DUF2760 domain-containing protein [Rhodospirillales bacterium]
MRVVTVVAAIALLLLSGLLLWPAAAAYHQYLPLASMAVAAMLLIAILVGGTHTRQAEPQTPEAETAKPARPPVIENQADAEVVSFLALFQEKGRFIDFLMEDITGFSDAQVGTAARVVHQGCQGAIKEHFRIRSVRDESEGSRITVAAGFAADEYRFVGKLAGEPPFSGTLVHRGWKTDRVELPRLLRSDGDRLPTIAPAEVELK